MEEHRREDVGEVKCGRAEETGGHQAVGHQQRLEQVHVAEAHLMEKDEDVDDHQQVIDERKAAARNVIAKRKHWRLLRHCEAEDRSNLSGRHDEIASLRSQ